MRKPNCKECPIGKEPLVPGLGTYTEGTKLFAARDGRPFDLVITAMAPAEEEIRQKRPMVGPSGLFLRKTLNQLGISEYHITNCLLCPIPNWAEKADINKAVECCRPRHEDEILEKKPKLILALGDMPLVELCGNDYGITESEGRLLMSRLNIPLVPVRHPAYFLRRPDDAFDFLECTRAGIRYLNNNYHQVGEVTRETVTEETVDAVLEELWKHDILTVDAETSGFYALGLTPDLILEIGISYDNKHCYIVPITDTTDYTRDTKTLRPYPNIISKFKELLETKRIRTWNGFFDDRFLRALGIVINHWFDGMLAHYCLDERQYSHGLKKVTRVYLGAGNWEKNIQTYLKKPKEDSYALIPTEVRHDYLSKDVCYTNEMCELLNKEVKDNWAFWNILMPATRVFSETMYRGVLIDPYKLVDMKNQLWSDINRDEKELYEMAGRVFNPASHVDVARIVYDDLGVPVSPKYGRSTNKKLFERLREEHEIIDRIVLHREMNHDLSQYVEGFAKRVDRDFRVHPTIRMFGTVTGRISSEDPSIMNIKRDGRIKEIFIANKGRYLAEFDLAKAELCWYIIYSGDEVLRDILINGFQGDLGFELTNEQRKDPHYLIGCIAYGQERAYELRAFAKMTVFGKLYLRGLGSIERQYGTEIARRLVDTVDDFIPKHKDYTSMIKKQIRTQGYVESFFKRQRRFPLITQENRSEVDRMAVNMPISSASSDLNLLNFIYLYENRKRWDIWPMFTVHDSIMVDIPSPDVIPEMKKEMEAYALELVDGKMPFTYDVKWGKSWGEAKEWEAA
ncbi:hypothetical protein LCGC14_1628950 [marine sediment metagenome]|uniref:DNA-directed DNA polymerase n=1 Tax=marine sediment metagenome TaxID=412755 RepID=A0A0F9L316_9ZZZZ